MTVEYILFQVLTISAFLFRMMMLIYMISSWFVAMQNMKWVKWIKSIVDPYVNFFRKFIPPIGVIDFSFLVAFFAFTYLSGFLIRGIMVSYGFIAALF